MVAVKEKKYGGWDEVGCFTGFATNDGFDYHISGGGDSYSDDRYSYWLEWDGEFGRDGRFYQLREDSRASLYMDRSTNLRGEQELFESHPVQRLMRAIVSQAYKWIEFERQQAARATAEEEARQRNPLRRLLGL